MFQEAREAPTRVASQIAANDASIARIADALPPLDAATSAGMHRRPPSPLSTALASPAAVPPRRFEDRQGSGRHRLLLITLGLAASLAVIYVVLNPPGGGGAAPPVATAASLLAAGTEAATEAARQPEPAPPSAELLAPVRPSR